MTDAPILSAEQERPTLESVRDAENLALSCIRILAAELATLRAEVERLTQERDEARKERNEWYENFIALEHAVVGDTGLSAILTVPKLKAAADRVEMLEKALRDVRFRMSLPDIRDIVVDEPWLARVNRALGAQS